MEFIWTDELVYEYCTSHMIMSTFKQSKQRKPLFTTEDGKDVFEGDGYWFVEDDFSIVYTESAYPYERTSELKYFSTKDAAKEYIFHNKPVLSLNDVCGAITVGYADLISLTKMVKSRL